MKNVHLLPTDKPSRLHNKNGDLGNYPSTKLYIEDFKGNQHNSFHIYITNDEEIKKGDWVITNNGLLAKVITEFTWHFINSKKIILTTDHDLIKEGIQAIDDEFLEWFVKNPSCEDVEIVFNNRGISGVEKILKTFGEYKIIAPKEEPKQETLEEAAEINCESITHPYCDREKAMFIKGAKWQQESMYEIMNAYVDDVMGGCNLRAKEWFEQFKKK